MKRVIFFFVKTFLSQFNVQKQLLTSVKTRVDMLSFGLTNGASPGAGLVADGKIHYFSLFLLVPEITHFTFKLKNSIAKPWLIYLKFLLSVRRHAL